MYKMEKTIIFIVTLLLGSAAFAAQTHTIIFVDAGSSGSRLHVYQFTKSSSLPVIKKVFSESIKPGLSFYSHHPDKAGSSLKKLFDDATQFIKKNGINPKDTPVDILSTGGMRILPQNKQAAIDKDVFNFLKKNYPFPIEAVKVISGQMEGLYGWLSINYLSGNFIDHQSTQGSIDMGGLSTQIVFATPNHNTSADDIEININHHDYHVFSKSFLGMGQDKVRTNLQNDPKINSCYPKKHKINEVMGDFNLASCSAIYARMIKESKISQEVIPVQNGQSFVAHQGYYYVYNFFNVTTTPDQSSLRSRIRTVCAENWDQLQDKYPQVKENYLSSYCANGVYADQLLYNTYKLNGSQLTVTNQIRQQDIDWTLGALLYQLTQKV